MIFSIVYTFIVHTSFHTYTKFKTLPFICTCTPFTRPICMWYHTYSLFIVCQNCVTEHTLIVSHRSHCYPKYDSICMHEDILTKYLPTNTSLITRIVIQFTLSCITSKRKYNSLLLSLETRYSSSLLIV